ncbi:MAG: Uma2 family endonuclease [Bacteroidota bacterium]
MSGLPTKKIPATYAEFVKFMDLPTSEGETLSFPASWETYLDLLETVDFTIEFHENTIYAMSIASDPHEIITSNIITRLNLLLEDEPDMAVRSSNRHIYIKKYQKDYAPDAHVVKGEPVMHTLRKGLDANTNPWLIVEVLSPSTEKKDWSIKLPFYKKIPSLKHILYIKQNEPFVSVFNRKGKTNKWENTDYDDLSDFVVLNKQFKISMKKIYKKVLLQNT